MKGFGHPQFGAEFSTRSKNFAALRVSLFGGEFEVNTATETLLKATAFGASIDCLKGALAFNAGMSYKSPLDKLLAKAHEGGKYIKIGMDSKRIALVGMQKGLTFAADKTQASFWASKLSCCLVVLLS